MRHGQLANDRVELRMNVGFWLTKLLQFLHYRHKRHKPIMFTAQLIFTCQAISSRDKPFTSDFITIQHFSCAIYLHQFKNTEVRSICRVTVINSVIVKMCLHMLQVSFKGVQTFFCLAYEEPSIDEGAYLQMHGRMSGGRFCGNPNRVIPPERRSIPLAGKERRNRSLTCHGVAPHTTWQVSTLNLRVFRKDDVISV